MLYTSKQTFSDSGFFGSISAGFFQDDMGTSHFPSWRSDICVWYCTLKLCSIKFRLLITNDKLNAFLKRSTSRWCSRSRRMDDELVTEIVFFVLKKTTSESEMVSCKILSLAWYAMVKPRFSDIIFYMIRSLDIASKNSVSQFDPPNHVEAVTFRASFLKHITFVF